MTYDYEDGIRQLVAVRYSSAPEWLIPYLVERGIRFTPSLNTSMKASNSSSIANSTVNSPGFYKALDTNRTKLCGFPPFCSSSTVRNCSGTRLWDCEQCNMVGVGFFVALAAILAMLIICGNLLVIASSLGKEKRNLFDRIKASLAVADLLTGVQILCIGMYNFAWTFDSTPEEIDQRQLDFQGSGKAIAGGIFYFGSFSSSLYHLAYLSIQRLYAVNWPIRYSMQSEWRAVIGLTVVWTCALITATLPLWVPGALVFTYYHTSFIFSISLSKSGDTASKIAAGVLLVISTGIPYLFMLACTTVTGVVGFRRLRKGSKLRKDTNDESQARQLRRELTILKTVAIMQLGFTVTLLPVVIVAILSYVNYLNCSSVSLPYLVCVYLSMANSLVNVLVYSVRDPCFKSSVRGWAQACMKRLGSSK